MMILSEALSKFYESMDGVLSPATVRFYKVRLRDLDTVIGDVPIESITIDMLRAWRLCLTRRNTKWGGRSAHPEQPGKLSPFTIHQCVRACRKFFKWLWEEGALSTNPAKRLELPQLPEQYRRGITESDRDKIINAALKSERPERDQAICLILADTGCRLGGVAGLKLSDLDLDHRRALVSEKGRGGMRKERMVFFMPITVIAIRAWIKKRPSTDHDWLFTADDGARLLAGGIRIMIGRLAHDAGVTGKWNPHNWRHGAIRGMLRSGMPISAASKLAGHSSVKTTGDMYGVFGEEELAKIHTQHSWIK